MSLSGRRVVVVVPTEGEDSKKLRPVLDAIHERATGKLTVRCNDGRQIKAEDSNAVDVAITHIGVVLFYPKTVVSDGARTPPKARRSGPASHPPTG